MRLIAALAAALVSTATLAAPADAQYHHGGYRHGYHGGYGYHHRYGYHGGGYGWRHRHWGCRTRWWHGRPHRVCSRW